MPAPPTGPNAGGPRFSRRRLLVATAAVTTGAALASLGVSASRSAGAPIPQSFSDDAAWREAAAYQLLSKGEPELAIAVLRLAYGDGTQPADALEAEVAALKARAKDLAEGRTDAYKEGQQALELIDTTWALGLAVANASNVPGTAMLSWLVDLYRDDARRSVDGRAQPDLRWQAQLREHATARIGDALSRLRPKLLADDGLAGVWDRQVGLHINVGSREGFSGLAQKNDHVANLSWLLHLDAQGADIASLLGRLHQQVDRTTTAVDSIIGQLADADAARRAAAQQQAVIEAARSSIHVLGELIGLADPRLGQQVRVVGDAALQIAVAVSQFSLAKTLTAVGAATLTAGVVGAALSIVSVLMASGPSPEQLILNQLQAISNQIRALGAQLNERFDRIDRSLSLIWDTLTTRLDRIEWTLGRVQGDVTAIARDLASARSEVKLLERNAAAFLAAGFRRPLIEALDGITAFFERTTAAMPYQPDYVNAESLLSTWVTSTAFEPLEAGPLQRDFGDDAVADELASLPLESNLNYLAGFLASRSPSWGVPTFATSRLPNPRDWALAADGYAALALEWPEHARRIAHGRLDDIIAVGKDFRGALRGISMVGPRANRSLVARLVRNYDDKAAALASAIADEAASYRLEVEVQIGKGRVGLDLWGGPTQVLDFVPEHGNVCLCDGAILDPVYPVVRPPTGLLRELPRYVLASYLNLGKLGLCIALVDFRGNRYDWVPMEGGFSFREVAMVRVVMDVMYAGNRVQSRHVLSPEVPVVSSARFTERVGWWWENEIHLRQRLEASSVRSAEPPAVTAQFDALLAQTSTAIEGKLRSYQKALHARIAGRIHQAGAVRDAARRLDGARALLQATIALGFPRALAADDALRGLLFGVEPIFDSELIGQLYAAATQRDDGARVDLTGQLKARLDRLVGALGPHLDRIDAGTWLESHPLVENTMRRLETARALRAAGGSRSNLELAAEPARLTADQALLRVRVTNRGPDTAFDMTLKDVLPTGSRVLALATPSTDYSLVGPELVCRLPPLAPGASHVLEVSVSRAPGQTLTHEVTLRCGYAPLTVVTVSQRVAEGAPTAVVVIPNATAVPVRTVPPSPGGGTVGGTAPNPGGSAPPSTTPAPPSSPTHSPTPQPSASPTPAPDPTATKPGAPRRVLLPDIRLKDGSRR